MVIWAVGIGPDFDSSIFVVSSVEPDMRRLVLLAGLLFYGPIVATGCSSSSSEPAKVDGMTPAEYREKGEPSARAAPAKAQKTKGARQWSCEAVPA
jgi:hypothetical protein